MPERKPRRRMPAAQRREVILGAAEEVFGRSGYHGASLDEIAHAAGVSKALIYEHFASKRDLHASLLHHHVDEIFRRLEANAETGATGEERLRGGVDAFLGFVEEHREAYRALLRDAADPDIGRGIAQVQAQATNVIAALLAEGGRPARALEMHAQLLSGAVQSLANWWYEHQDVPRRALVDRVVEFSWVGLERLAAAVTPPAGRAPTTSAARSSTGSR